MSWCLGGHVGAIERSAAQDWPTRPVKVIVPYPPGGGADTVSRILFGKLSEALGQQFVIDNRGGAGGTIGAAAAAKAEGRLHHPLRRHRVLGEPFALSAAVL